MTPLTKSLFLLCLPIVSLALAPGCNPQSEAPAAAAPKTVYRHSMDGAPRSLDPAQASSIYGNFLAVNLYDTLYRYRYLARPYELAPNLAEAMPQVSGDGLVYTIRLRPDVRFIDDPAFPDGVGRPVRAGDVVYSIKRHFDPATRAQGAWLWQGRIEGLNEWKENGSDYDQDVSGLTALDDHTLQIRLTSPFPQLAHTLAHGLSAVVPREAVERYRREFATHPVGSGPFRLEKFDSARAILARNKGFRNETFSLVEEGFDPSSQGGLGLESLEGRPYPFMDRIEVEFIAEDAARWNSFIAGELDFIKVPVTQFDQVLASRDPLTLKDTMSEPYNVIANLESGFVHTDFNMSDPRIGYNADPEREARNTALRCAIIKAFDWRKRNEIFYYDIGYVFPGIIPPVAPEFDRQQDTASLDRDIEGARRLLLDHGWTPENLPVLEYGYPSSVTERQMFEQFRSFLGEIGYPEDKIKPLIYATYGDYARAYLNREVMLVTIGWTMDYPDAENTVQLFYGPNATPGSNIANYNNVEFNGIFRESSGMPSSARRTELFQAMNRLVIDDCVTISGVSRRMVLLWSRELALLPDRSFVGGFFFRFVAPTESGTRAGQTSRP